MTTGGTTRRPATGRDAGRRRLDRWVGRLVNEAKGRNMAISYQLPARDDGVPSEVTSTGFRFGAATVDRMTTLPGGQACIRVETPKMALNIRVTKTGKMIVTTDSGIEVLVTR